MQVIIYIWDHDIPQIQKKYLKFTITHILNISAQILFTSELKIDRKINQAYGAWITDNLSAKKFILNTSSRKCISVFINGNALLGTKHDKNLICNISELMNTSDNLNLLDSNLLILNNSTNANPNRTYKSNILHHKPDINLDTEKLPDYIKLYTCKNPVSIFHAFDFCISYSDRPWYSIQSHHNHDWILTIRKLIKKRIINYDNIKSDINSGYLRNSIQYQLDEQQRTPQSPPRSILNKDDYFIIPALKVTHEQTLLLTSKKFNARLIKFYRKSRIKKIQKNGYMYYIKHTLTKTGKIKTLQRRTRKVFYSTKRAIKSANRLTAFKRACHFLKRKLQVLQIKSKDTD